MTNNDILRRLRYALDLNDSQMMALFSHGGEPATRAQVSAWLKRSEDPAAELCEDGQLLAFLDGLVLDRRGPPAQPLPPNSETETRSNNLVLRKLKIAMNLRAPDILDLLQLGGMRLSKPELSALFRSPTHKHYRVCQDQLLRNFLRGLQLQLRPGTKAYQEGESSSGVHGPVAVSIEPEQTVDLRHRVLWPEEPKDFVRLAEDAAGKHFGVLLDDKIVSVVSLFVSEGHARFRKFATEPALQGRGYGTLLLRHIAEQAKQLGATHLGCRARVDKASFYERFGLRSTGEHSNLGSVQYVYMAKEL